MIEQIINWFNSLTYGNKEDLLVGLAIIIVLIGCYYFAIIRPYFKVKRKTTTQKYREGLIKK